MPVSGYICITLKHEDIAKIDEIRGSLSRTEVIRNIIHTYKDKLYTCGVCGKVFEHEHEWINHLWNKHFIRALYINRGKIQIDLEKI